MNDCHRRGFLKTSIAAFAGLAASLPHIGCAARRANAHLGRMRDDTPLNWDAFLSEVVDIFTPLYDADRIARARWFEVDEEPFEGKRGRFLAKVKA